MRFPIPIIFIAISLFTAVMINFRKGTPGYLRLFSYFLLATMIVEITGWFLSEKNISTLMLYNFFTTIEFVFYFWVLRQVISNKIAKKILLFCLYLYPLLVFFNVFFWMKVNSFHAVTYAMGCFLIATICIYYFLELFQRPHSVDLVRQPAFWICSGLLFFYSCSFPIFGFANFLQQLPAIIRGNLNLILNVMNSLLYISFTIAFLCRVKVRKSIL